MSARDWFLLIILSTVWGGSFFFFEVALQTLPPFTVVLGRISLAAAALLLIARARGATLPFSGTIARRYLLLGAISNAMPFSFIVWGQTQIPSGLASIINAMTPIWAVLVGLLIGSDERLTPARALGVLLGFAGVAVLMGPDLLREIDPYSLGQLSVLGATICYGFAVHYGRRFGDTPPLVNAAYMLTAATVWLTPVALIVDQPWTLSPGLQGWAALLGLSLLCTAFAYLLYFRILASAGATNMSLVTFIVPVSAISLGAVFLGERLGPTAFLGMGILFLGLAVIDGRLWRRLRRVGTGAAGRG
ncbi:DMT family transporter [Spiribacter onubensis]|uniref:DMT family transporter n=1 Tax=Spiribacter onubensis TaxID=3122420 RepID=A0ABV3S9F6_9GAMM